VLAKLANRLSKKDKDKTGCILVLDNDEKIDAALQQTAVADIWGIGHQYARNLNEHWGIYDALQLRNVTEEFARAQLGGVVGVRLIRELRGIPTREMEDELVTKKVIATTRMFGSPVGDIASIREAVATYTSRAAEKLRRQKCAAKMISIFVVAKEQDYMINFRDRRSHGTMTRSVLLPVATSFTHELIKPAVELVDQVYTKGTLYKKAGVMLSNIVPDQSIQGNLFLPGTKNSGRMLMDMIDNVNFSQRDDVLKFAASGTTRDWKMRQELRSPRYTTRWEELYEIR
jgi:DNA polymerase V